MFIKVNYEYITNTEEAYNKLQSLPDVFSADFESANKFTKKELEVLSNSEYNILTDNTFQQINATGLSHPALTTITHLSIAWSECNAFVIICTNEDIKSMIYDFLTTTNKLQIWHNTLFDFKHIYYHKKSIPKNYEDTFLLARCLNNNANGMKCEAGLKRLMGRYYGAWGEAREADFVLEDIFNETLIKYAATDACATYKLYQVIKKHFGWEN